MVEAELPLNFASRRARVGTFLHETGSEHSEEKEPVIHVSFGTGQPIERPETGPKHTKCESIYLLLGYTTGFQVWDVTHLDSIFEVNDVHPM